MYLEQVYFKLSGRPVVTPDLTVSPAIGIRYRSEFVRDRYDREAWTELKDEAGIDGVTHSRTGGYPDEECLIGVHRVSARDRTARGR